MKSSCTCTCLVFFFFFNRTFDASLQISILKSKRKKNAIKRVGDTLVSITFLAKIRGKIDLSIQLLNKIFLQNLPRIPSIFLLTTLTYKKVTLLFSRSSLEKIEMLSAKLVIKNANYCALQQLLLYYKSPYYSIISTNNL